MDSAAPDAPGDAASGSGTILLVEDNPAYIRLVRELLTEAGLAGFELEWADLLEKGLDRLEAGGIDLILLDLLLPDNMGTNTLRVVLENAGDTPVVVLTGIEDDELASQALDLGAVDYLCKGRLDAERLARSVRYALEEAAPSAGRDATTGEVEPGRVLPHAADRLESAAACLDAVETHLDPLAPEDAPGEVQAERDQCRRVADGLREIATLIDGDPPRERVSLQDVVDDALVRLSASGPTGGRVTLTWRQAPQVLGDRARLVRMFELLLSQMLTFREDGPAHVEIGAARQGDRWEIRIQDDDPPPSATDPLGRLFASHVDDQRVSGALARTLCEAIAAGHGGRLWLESANEGTALAVSLPALSATTHAAEVQAQPDEPAQNR